MIYMARNWLERIIRRSGDLGRHLLAHLGSIRAVRRQSHSGSPVTVCCNEQLESRILASADPVIGVNLDPVTDWNPAWVFTDVFKTSRPWTAHSFNTVTGEETWGTGGTVAVDANGWPTQLKQWTNEQGQLMQQRLGTTMFRSIDGTYPAGIYRVEWEGTGSVSFGFTVKVIEQGRSGNMNYALLNVTPSSGGLYFRINTMDPGDPIRNVHVWMPDYNGQSFAGQVWHPGAGFSPFHPLFLERLKPFGVLRFMDWGSTNTSTLEHWQDRTTVDSARQSSSEKGVAYEYMIELANELDADAWLNMPYLADDDFVRNYATLVRDSLEPDRLVYIEWSNEIWNTDFRTYNWVTEQLQKPENAGLDRWALVAREIKRDFSIWSEVFQGQEDRLVRVVAGQATLSARTTSQILQYMDGQFDAISAGGYIYPPTEVRNAFTTATTGDEVAQATLDDVPRALDCLKAHKALADEYSARLGRQILLTVYEGGQHLVANASKPYQQAYVDAQTSPLMYQAYEQLFKGFREIAGDLFLHYAYVARKMPAGSFGSLEYQTQPASDAPKYRAVVDAATGAMFYAAPAASAGSLYSVVEGGSATLSAADSTGHLLSYAWDLDGDGIFGETGAQAVHGDETGVHPTFLAAGLNGPTTWTVALRVDDGHGRHATTSTIINVNNTPPTLIIRGGSSLNEGATYTLNLSSFDPGPDTITHWLINWGDGSQQTVPGNPSTVTHVYADNGSYTIVATASDQDGTYPAGSLAVAVSNVAPTLAMSGPSTISEDLVYRLNLLTSDPGADTISTWIVNWGDGPTQTITGNPAYLTHVYASSGDYIITAAAIDEDGAYSAGNKSVLVKKVDYTAPMAELMYGSSIVVIRSSSVSPKGSYLFSVRYSDNVGIDWSSLKTGNLLITAGTYSQAAALVSAKLQSDGSVVATYGFAPPGGRWDTPDNQTYTLSIGASPVRDTANNPVPAQKLGYFQVSVGIRSVAPMSVGLDATTVSETSGSFARVASASSTNSPANAYTFKVTYAPEGFAVYGRTIGNGDILVSNGKNGFQQYATLVSKQRGRTQGSVVATYQILAPGGRWDPSDNATYTVRLMANQVKDTTGRALPAAVLGKFAVKIPSTTRKVASISTSSVTKATPAAASPATLASPMTSATPSWFGVSTTQTAGTAEVFNSTSRIGLLD